MIRIVIYLNIYLRRIMPKRNKTKDYGWLFAIRSIKTKNEWMSLSAWWKYPFFFADRQKTALQQITYLEYFLILWSGGIFLFFPKIISRAYCIFHFEWDSWIRCRNDVCMKLKLLLLHYTFTYSICKLIKKKYQIN